MAKTTNFLLGSGENLTGPVELPRGGSTPRPPYTFLEAKTRLSPQVQRAADAIAELSPAACPRDYAVAVMTLHPEYIAKSYHPSRLLSAVGLEAVGSRPRKLAPEKWRPKSESTRAKRPPPEEAEGVDLFVAGKRARFQQFANVLPTWTEHIEGAGQLFEVEQFRAATSGDRLRPLQTDAAEPLLEVVLHVFEPFVIESFEAYLATFQLKADIDRRYVAGSLCFMPLRSPRELLEEVAQFAFLRVVREMPRLRPLRPVSRSFQGLQPFECVLPTEPPLDRKVKAVVFDGGLPVNAGLEAWVTTIEGQNLTDPLPEFLEHGLAVTSALLFGPLDAGMPPSRPYAHVDHVRVLDDESDKDEDLYDVLPRIRTVLETGKYQYVNFSIGPYLPIEDDDVHAWTVMLDQYLSTGNTLAAVAVGNSGHLDRATGNARVQVPSDCVNAVAVGACDRRSDGWRRASYSSLGPGRSPGLVKPDVLSFGGWDGEPFWVLDAAKAGHTVPTFGTSFATPSVLRMALGVRAHFGDVMSPLALRALLIHAAEDDGHERHEVGWGRLAHELESIVVCPEGMARVVYQGVLDPSGAIRAFVPVPNEPLDGKVTIHATMCFATTIDPAHPSNYTRSGVEIFFRPHIEKRNKSKEGLPPSLHAKTKSFFQVKNYSPESDLRRDAHKWETVLNRAQNFQGRSLKDPAFDIYYHAREGSQATTAADKIRYALIVTVRSPRTPDLYDGILRRYRTRLTPLTPLIQIPVRTTAT
ncbi:MAG: S8 family peptidase [Planctomycetia bacterium]|nr:MAG: S8 family peptidase [Planctomycetia bacterium]